MKLLVWDCWCSCDAIDGISLYCDALAQDKLPFSNRQLHSSSSVVVFAPSVTISFGISSVYSYKLAQGVCILFFAVGATPPFRLLLFFSCLACS